MKLSKKDYLIIALIFVLVLCASTFGLQVVFRDNVFYPLLMNNIVMGSLARLGYVLIYPVMLIFMTPFKVWELMGMNVLPDAFFIFLPWLTTFIYTAFFAFCLAIYNDRKKNRK